MNDVPVTIRQYGYRDRLDRLDALLQESALELDLPGSGPDPGQMFDECSFVTNHADPAAASAFRCLDDDGVTLTPSKGHGLMEPPFAG